MMQAVLLKAYIKATNMMNSVDLADLTWLTYFNFGALEPEDHVCIGPDVVECFCHFQIFLKHRSLLHLPCPSSYFGYAQNVTVTSRAKCLLILHNIKEQ